MSRIRKLGANLVLAGALAGVAAGAIQAAEPAAAPHGTTAMQRSAGTPRHQAYKGERLARQARISLAEARAIALKAHEGQITDEELEAEPGGSGLRYSFDIKDREGTHEVGVDARTGKVLENKLEGTNPD